mgnify:CR=1 FL=1
MKISLTKIDANPYRDFDVHPLDPELIETLKSSIDDLGFWGGIAVRKHGDGYQLAFGHHRVEALRLLGIKTADINVVKYDDAQMGKAMVMENSTQRGTCSTADLDNVKAANLVIGFEMLTREYDDLSTIVQRCFPNKKAFDTATGIFKKGKGLGRDAVRAFSDGSMSRRNTDAAIKQFEESDLLSSTMEEIQDKIDVLIAEREAAEEAAKTAAAKKKAEEETKKAQQAAADAALVADQVVDSTFDYNVTKLFDHNAHAEQFRESITNAGAAKFIAVEDQYACAEQLIADIEKRGDKVTTTAIRLGVSQAVAVASGMQREIDRLQRKQNATTAVLDVYHTLGRLLGDINEYEDFGVQPNITPEKASDILLRVKQTSKKLDRLSKTLTKLSGKKVVSSQ